MSSRIFVFLLLYGLLIKELPIGAIPLLIIALDASSVSVLTLQVNNPDMSGSEIYDMASSLIRPGLVSVAGTTIHHPKHESSAQLLVFVRFVPEPSP